MARPRKGKKAAQTAANVFELQRSAAAEFLHRSDVMVGEESARVVIGVPLRPLSLQWLFHNTVFPFGRMSMLVGESMSGKTGFLFDTMRWHLEMDDDSGALFQLNEPRDSPDYRESFLGDKHRNVIIDTCQVLEDWQSNITTRLQGFEKTFRQRGGCAFSVCIGLDSLTGTTSKRITDGIAKEGHATLNYGIDANLINSYVKFLFPRLRPWPFTFVATNHAKFRDDKFGNRVLNIPGGTALWFYSTFVLLFKRRADIFASDASGYNVDITTKKNSLGEGNHTIKVRVLWRFDEQNQQHSWFDWDGASVDFLLDYAGPQRKALDDLISFPTVHNNVRRCNCPRLGIRQPAPYAEVGLALSQDAALMRELQGALGIRIRRAYQPGIPYFQQEQQAREEGSVALEKPALPDELDIRTEDEVEG